MEDKQAKKSNSGGYQGGQGTYQPQQYQSTYSSPNYDLLLKALEMKQARYERDEQAKKERAISLSNQTKEYYNSLTSFPEQIKDGWHTVIVSNNYDICGERKVYVESNKVTKYVIDDWYNKDLSFSANII